MLVCGSAREPDGDADDDEHVAHAPEHEGHVELGPDARAGPEHGPLQAAKRHGCKAPGCCSAGCCAPRCAEKSVDDEGGTSVDLRRRASELDDADDALLSTSILLTMSKQVLCGTLKLLSFWCGYSSARQWPVEPCSRRTRRSVRDRTARCARHAAHGTTPAREPGACVQRAQRATISGEGVECWMHKGICNQHSRNGHVYVYEQGGASVRPPH